jgi:hypothetical protein
LTSEDSTALAVDFESPLIITGMHRSGTSLLCRVLEQLGVFVGRKKERNHEATLFLQINDWLLREAGVTWDRPDGISALTGDAELVRLAAAHVKRVLDSNQLIGYLGWWRSLRHRRVQSFDFPWGFKDPRTSLTLPVWLAAFPEARVLYIHRTGVDVANSLKVRSEAILRDNLENDGPSLPLRYRLEPRPRISGNLAMSLRCLSLEGGFELWKEYCDAAEQTLNELPVSRCHTVGFEEFVRDPVAQIPRLCELAGVEHRAEFDESVRAMMRRGKVDRHRRDQALGEFYRRVATDPRMLRFGYGSPADPVTDSSRNP